MMAFRGAPIIDR